MAENDQKGDQSNDLGEQFRHMLSAVGQRAIGSATDRIEGLGSKLAGSGGGGGAVAKGAEKLSEGSSPAKAAMSAGTEGLKSAFGGGSKGDDDDGGGGGSGQKVKVTNIIEEIDIGAPVSVVYNQWTQFQDFSGFMKKVESVDQQDEQRLDFKAQVLWSHRTWHAEIVDQVPDKRIVWKSHGEKGHVDGAVTFHELAPELTRVLVVLEYHPQGLFERTGNLWRAPGRRARLELKHFRRHVMTHAVLHPDELEGWRGEIHEGDVVKSHDEAKNEEAEESGESDDEEQQPEQDEGQPGEGDQEQGEPQDEDESDEPEDELDEEEPREDEEGEADESDDEDDEDDEDVERHTGIQQDEEDDYDDEEDEPAPERGSGRSQGRSGGE